MSDDVFIKKRRRERYEVRDDAGASGETRTPDLLITNQLLYRLSYTSITGKPGKAYLNRLARECQSFFACSWPKHGKKPAPGKKRLAVLNIIR